MPKKTSPKYFWFFKFLKLLNEIVKPSPIDQVKTERCQVRFASAYENAALIALVSNPKQKLPNRLVMRAELSTLGKASALVCHTE